MRVTRGVFSGRRGRNGAFAALAVLVLLCGTAGDAFGQAATGTITGTVTDAQGAAMVGANVVARDLATGVEKTAVTNNVGLYNIPLLQPGNYNITASQTGFATVQRTGVNVQVGQTIRIDVEMPVAAQQSLVTVTAETPILETEKTEVSQNVNENLVSNLPISSRRWEQFVLLTGGTATDGDGGDVSFRGLNSGYNKNTVDGANNQNHYNNSARGGGGDAYLYSGEAIREFQVKSSGFNAEMGQAAGGAVNAVTKSGTNVFHGAGFYNLRYPSLNAIDPVAKADAAAAGTEPTQAVHQQHQYGGTLGGPIVKDKLFFFTSYDAYRKVTPIQYTSSNHPATLPCPAVVGAARCGAVVNWLSTNNLGTFPRLLRQDIELIKLDYTLNASNNISAVTNIRDWKQPNGTAFATSNNSGVTTAGTSFNQDRFVIARWNSVLSNTMVNEFMFQYGKTQTFTSREGSFTPFVNISQITGYFNNNGSTWTDEKRRQVADNFSITKGTHTFKMGTDMNFILDDARSATNSAGRYDFTGVTSGPCTGSGAQRTWCNFLIDLYGINVGDGLTGLHWNTYAQIKDEVFSGPPATFRYIFFNRDYAFYFQDTWKARPNMTVDYGVRYDIQHLPQPPHGAVDVYGPGIANTIPLLHEYTRKIPNDYTAIQPRFGLAWNFSQRSVLRVGGGIFFGKTSGSLFKTVVSGAGESNINCTPTTAGPETPTNPLNVCTGLRFPDVLFAQQDVVPNTVPVPGAVPSDVLNPTIAACPSPSCGIRGIDPSAQRPRVYQGQVALEQQIPGNMNLSVTYLFNRGVKLPSHKDANIAPTSLFKQYDVVDDSGLGRTELATSVPLFTQRLNWPLGSPNGLGTGPIIAEFSEVLSMYHGLVVSLRKPMSRGIEFLANYTLSRAVDNGMAAQNLTGFTFQSTDGVLNPYDMKGEEGFSGTDTRNRFTASAIWTPNFGQNASSSFARGFLRGWTLSSTATVSNGSRYSGLVSSTSQPCQTATANCAANIRGVQGGMTGALIQTTGNRIGGRISWVPRASFVLPNIYNVDARLAKNINFTERFALEIRAEMFNVFNSTQVLGVEQNAYNYAQPTASTITAPQPACWNGVVTSGPGPAAGTQIHASTCMVPLADFQRADTTSTNSLGARQVQFGARLSF